MRPTRDRVLVSGGAGFIGSALVERLVAHGEVVVVDNLANGKRENLAHLPADRVRLILADVRAPDSYRRELDRVRCVYHLACLGVRHSLHSPRENHDVNAAGTLTLLETARAAGVQRFVHVSTSEVYGPAITNPMGEDHRTQPTTAYGASKLAGETYARAFHRSDGFLVSIVRPFNAYGPRCHHEGDAGEVIPKFMLRALAGEPLIVFGGGTQTRDFTYVEDTAAGIAAAGRNDAAAGTTINLGSGRAVGIRDLAHLVGRVTGRSIRVVHDEPRPGDLAALCADARRAGQLIGFRARVSLEDGLSRLLAWYRAMDVSPQELLAVERPRNWESTSGSELRHVG